MANNPVATPDFICLIGAMLSPIEDINNPLFNLHQLPPKKRLDAIINHPTPMKLIRSMKTPDILLTIREVGAESSLELVEMLHPEQVQELLDLEIWSSDRLNIKAAGHYFSLLFEANRDTATAQIHGLDIELIGLMFKMVAEIYDASLSEEPAEFPEIYSVSPDGRFIVCFLDKKGYEGLARALHTFLEELYGRDLPFALRLLESIRFELASLLEEESLRFRQNRLLDFGILPKEERLLYFSPVAKHEIKSFQGASSSLKRETLPIRSINTHVDEKYPFLKRALIDASDEIKENFSHSVTHAFVNMHASLSGDFGDREQIENTSAYVKFLFELGVFQYCHGNIDHAFRGLSEVAHKNLVRLGRTAITNLRKRLVEKLKDPTHVFGKDFCHVDSPLREVAKALSLPEPRFYEGLLDSKKLIVRYFLTLAELNATVNAVNELIFRARILGENGLAFDEKTLADYSHLSSANIVARSIANRFLHRENLLASINDDDISHIYDGKKLNDRFLKFAKDFAENLAQQFSHLENHDDIAAKTSAFITVILIAIEQNWRLLLE